MALVIVTVTLDPDPAWLRMNCDEDVKILKLIVKARLIEVK